MNRPLLITLALWAATLAPATADVSLSAPAFPSGTFDVTVNATNVFAPPHDAGDFLLGYGFDLTYNSAVLQYLGETAGALFDDLSGNPGITADVAGVATAILLGPGDFIEPLLLATLHFAVIAPGATTVGITGDIADLNQGLIYLSSSEPISASVSLTAVPEPAGVTLLGTAVLLVGLGLRRVRR